MTNSQTRWNKPARTLFAAMACSAVLGLAGQAAFAQSGERVHKEYPQLADLLNAFDLTQAKTFEEIAKINAEPGYKAERAELREHMDMMKGMTMSEMMASGMMSHGGMSMHTATSPYPDMEVASRINLLALMRAKHDDKEVANAYMDNAAIGRHAAVILRRGRDFENTLFEIYLDDSIRDKKAAIDAAIAEYLSDESHSVSSLPTASRYLIDHDQATGFQTAFPRLSGLMWTQQWLQLAALESIILGQLDKQFAGSVNGAMERFWNKVGTDGGMSMFPAPTELPMSPAIAPDLYTQSPEAAVILDNLNILETVLADILSYPDEQDLETKMDTAIALFTNKEVKQIDRPLDYLLFALRGGIYDQGGPAVGDLTRSERNRSRDAMNMVHVATMKTGQ
ncbi:MAG: hypothetical protein H7A07_02615 [Pseudomonadales bacterium]|nr:hypothetical protein [Pseudomonadales bacterium]MCP5329827.1 hypothetical protein [Pseudomonadales bacterium]